MLIVESLIGDQLYLDQ